MIIVLSTLFLLSCNNNTGNKIEKVSITKEYYRDALDQVSKAYEKSPSNELLRRKLYFLRLLNWPEGSVQTLEIAQNRFGLTDEIVHNLAAFYLSRENYDDLYDLLKDWKRYSELDRELSQIQVELLANTVPSKTLNALISYSKSFQEEKDFNFIASKSYLLADTAEILPIIKELANEDHKNVLVNHWLVPVLLKRNRNKEARKYLVAQLASGDNEASLTLLAKSFLDENVDTAKVVLRSMGTFSSYSALSDIFESQRRYDSAVYYVDKQINLDSSRNLVFRKASLLEQRRWLSSSYYLFNLLSEADSTDSISRKRASVVANKIAYLRSLEELVEDVPILELKPKKQVENE
ncbi:MAG: hypothetical protein RIC03_11760 [Cyclobacteriaceae bacterium]